MRSEREKRRKMRKGKRMTVEHYLRLVERKKEIRENQVLGKETKGKGREESGKEERIEVELNVSDVREGGNRSDCVREIRGDGGRQHCEVGTRAMAGKGRVMVLEDVEEEQGKKNKKKKEKTM